MQPIRRDLADVLREWLADKPADLPVFHRMPGETARMPRLVLTAARAAWIGEPDLTPAEQVRREKSDFSRLPE